VTSLPESSRDEARQADLRDPLAIQRRAFSLPQGPRGTALRYFCGHSLGLMPKTVRDELNDCLDDWANRGVAGHFEGSAPWYRFHEFVRNPLAKLVGALPDEVVAMNSLSINLHLMLVSFYRPDQSSGRTKVLTDAPLFASDRYALSSHIELAGLDPKDTLIVVEPEVGSRTLDPERIEEVLRREGPSVALVLLSGVNYLTGQSHDISRLTRAAHAVGAKIGWDLAHSVGNTRLNLHDDGPDFAVWCSYKYLNSGPGAVGGAFVHQRHLATDLPRLAGWWGNDPNTRFEFADRFSPVEAADAWQVSNPSVFSLSPLRSSLAIFEEVGMDAIEAKSRAMSDYLFRHLAEADLVAIEPITPTDPASRGSQVSLLVHSDPQGLVRTLAESGLVCDLREPNILRVAPVPLYCSFEDIWVFVDVLRRWARAQ